MQHTNASDAVAAVARQRIWKDTSRTAFVSGLHLEAEPPVMTYPVTKTLKARGGSNTNTGPRQVGEPRLLMSYGSSDVDSRLMILSLRQVEQLFDGSPDTC